MPNYPHKPVIQKQEFNLGGDDFESMYAAQHWLRQNGYDYGSTSAIEPTAVMRGNYYEYGLPHKMKNFSAKEIKMVHGIITGSMRSGPVIVYLFE